MLNRVILGSIVFLVASCGREAGDSDFSYIITSPVAAGLVWKVHQTSISICYQDATNNSGHKRNTLDSIRQWLSAIDDVSVQPVAKTINLVEIGQPCDATVKVGNYTPARTSMSLNPTVMMNYSGWFGSQTVNLHEFGHAFGMLDTYVGTGGSCMQGQPDSVMCRAKYAKLQSDDILGVQDMYKKVVTGKIKPVPESFSLVVE